MQIIVSKGKVIHSVELSELFPDYNSVLLDAIANGVDLTDLCVRNQNLEKFCFQGANIKGAQFKNCNLNKAEFSNCFSEGVLFDQCDLSGIKVKTSNLQNAHFSSCNISNGRFVNTDLNNAFIIDCNLVNSKFSQTKAENVAFHTSNIAKALFEQCSLMDSKFIHTSSTFEWLNDVSFNFCNLKDCDLSILSKLSMLFLHESNIHEAILKHQSFTTVINRHTKVLYAIDSDTIWWGSFRGNLAAFKNEIETEFPKTKVGQESEVFVYDELRRVLIYLEQWKI